MVSSTSTTSRSTTQPVWWDNVNPSTTDADNRPYILQQRIEYLQSMLAIKEDEVVEIKGQILELETRVGAHYAAKI